MALSERAALALPKQPASPASDYGTTAGRSRASRRRSIQGSRRAWTRNGNGSSQRSYEKSGGERPSKAKVEPPESSTGKRGSPADVICHSNHEHNEVTCGSTILKSLGSSNQRQPAWQACLSTLKRKNEKMKGRQGPRCSSSFEKSRLVSRDLEKKGHVSSNNNQQKP